jgi:hypothetical protein
LAARKKAARKKPGKRPRNPRAVAQAAAKAASRPSEPDPAPSASEKAAMSTEEATEIAEKKIKRVINPETIVELLDGTTVTVKPWMFDRTELMAFHLTKVVTSFMQAKEGSTDDIAGVLLQDAMPSTMVLVRESIGWDEEKFSKIYMEDGLELTKAMVTTCLMRSDGGGLLPKVAELMQLAQGLFSAAE